MTIIDSIFQGEPVNGTGDGNTAQDCSEMYFGLKCIDTPFCQLYNVRKHTINTKAPIGD